MQARQSPEIYVVDPKRLSPLKDPDEFVRARGPEAWRELIATRVCGIGWRAKELVIDVTPESSALERRRALARAGRWLGALPPRLALEAEDAVGVVAERCGYSAEAAARTLRARFWQAPERTGLSGRPRRRMEQALER